MSSTLDDTTSPATAPLTSSRQVPGAQGKCMPMLVCVEGLQAGLQFPIKAGVNLLGRGSGVDVCLQDDMASRRHARLTCDLPLRGDNNPAVTLEDLGSRNGTELNGERVMGKCVLQERDRILIGTTLLGYFLRDEKEVENEQLLYELATRDALTGLDNRHQFRTLLKHNIDRSRRNGVPLSLVMVDADHFKSVNDRHGHDVGDKVLIHLARTIEACCRSTELPARWGGEEFAILMPDADKTAAFALAERVRIAVETSPLKHGEGSIFLSISAGCAELGLGDDAERLFQNADQNLFKAKQLGRNRVCCV